MAVSKKDYFIFAMQNGLFNRKAWCFSAFAVIDQRVGWDGDTHIGQLIHKEDDQTVLRYVKPDGEMEVLEGYVVGKPLFTMQEKVTLNKGDIPNLNESVETTYGRALANAMVLSVAFGDKIPFINAQWNINALTDQIATMLRDDVITVSDLKLYFRQTYFMSSLTQLCVPSATEKTITTDPNIARRKAELLEQYKDQLSDPAIVSKIEQELIAMDKAFIEGDLAEGFYKSGKAFNVTRKRSHVMHGGETSFNDETKIDVVPTSLQEGWNADGLPTLINSLRDGSYSRGTQTALGGEAVKAITRVFQNSFITKDDCGDTVGIPMRITDNNHLEFVGRYEVGKTDKPLTEQRLKGLIGKTIMLRSPMACKVPFTDFCKTCMGDKLADNENALSLLAVNVGSSFLSLFMAAMHGKALVTEPVNLKEVIT